MGFESGIVLVLLVDEEPAGIGLVFVDLIHEAAGFFAGFRGEFFKDRKRLRTRVRF